MLTTPSETTSYPGVPFLLLGANGPVGGATRVAHCGLAGVASRSRLQKVRTATFDPEAQHPVGKKILVVDDNRLVLVGVAAVLEAEGFRVWTTDSAAEAIELAEQVQPDVVVTDMRMPSMDGISLLERLMDVTPKMPEMLIYSATTPPADRATDRMPGVRWVAKSAGHRTLLDVLEAS